MSSAPVASEVEPSSAFDQRAHAAVGILPIAGHPAAEPDRLRPDPLDHLVMQQHVELATMNRILRPVVAGQEPAGLGIDVIAVEPDQRPFLCGQAHPVEIVFGDAEIVEFTHGIGLQIDADAERAHVPDRFEDNAGHADLVERQGCRQPTNAAAGDDHKIIRHMLGSICNLSNSIIALTAPVASRLLID